MSVPCTRPACCRPRAPTTAPRRPPRAPSAARAPPAALQHTAVSRSRYPAHTAVLYTHAASARWWRARR